MLQSIPPSRDVVPPLKAYKDRTPESYVMALLQLNVKDPRYLKDRYGTKCNFLVHDAMQVLGVPMPRIGGWPMLANQMAEWWADRANGWQEMQWQDIVQSANYGLPSVASLVEPGHGHVAVILPASVNDERSIMVMQAGAVNFYGRQITYGFGLDVRPIKYYGRP